MRERRRRSKNSDDKSVIQEVRVERDGKAVFARHIDALHIYSSSHDSTIPLNRFATVPPLPVSFVERPEISEPLITKLLSSSGTIALTAIEGMFGVGKTISALALCHDDRVRARFPDGIVWLSVGRETKVEKEDRIKQVADALNKKFNVNSEEAYRSLLADKSVLIVLDDVWSSDTIEPFLMTSGSSRLLYTSRDKGLAGLLGAENHEVDILDEMQARNFLVAWAGLAQELLPEPYASEILAECQGLPLALAMIGAALRGKPIGRWRYLLDDLKTAKLREIRGRPSGYAYDTLHAAVAVSVDSLTPNQRAKYLRLAVVLEDMVLHPALLRALWGGNERDVDDLVCLFVDRSLASRDAAGGIRLHDLQLDYVRSEYADPTALSLLHRALTRSLHIVGPHPEQFTSQMIGRLLLYQNQKGVKAFLTDVDSCAPRFRLRPLQPALEPADSTTLRVLEGHTDSVTAVALSDDGKLVVSGDHDGSVRVWNLQGRQPPRILEGHGDSVRAVALSSDCKLVVSSTISGYLCVWDLEGKERPRALKFGVRGVALSSDGRVAILGSNDGVLRVWDIQRKRVSGILEGHISLVRAVAVSNSEKLVLSTSNDRNLWLWDLQSGQQPRILKGHSDLVNALVLSGDGKLAVSGGDDGTVRVWDLQSKQRARAPRILKGHINRVISVALSSDGKLVASGSEDGTLRIWASQGENQSRILEGHRGSVSAVALSSHSKLAVSGGADGTVRVWDLQGKQPPRLLETPAVFFQTVALSSNGKFAVSSDTDGTVRVWELQGNRAPRILKSHTHAVTAVALSSDGKLVVSGSANGMLVIWNLQGKQRPRVLRDNTSWVTALALSGKAELVIAGCSDGNLRVWDLRSKRRKQSPRVLEGHTMWVTAIALSGDSKLAVSGGADGNVRVWELQTKQSLRVFKGHTDPVNAVALSSDGKLAISGSDDGTVRVWKLEGEQPPRSLEGHRWWVTAVALSSNGNLAVSGSYDRTVRVWSLRSMETLAVFTCDFPVLACAWTEHGIVARDEAGQVHLLAWEE